MGSIPPQIEVSMGASAAAGSSSAQPPAASSAAPPLPSFRVLQGRMLLLEKERQEAV